MPSRNRRGAQLAFEVPPELLHRLRAFSAAQQKPMATLLRGWIEAGLAGPLEPLEATADSGVLERLEALEAAVAKLQRTPAPTPPPREVTATPRTGDALPSPPPKAAPPIPRMGDAPEGAITTAELAEQTSTNRAAWNNWARDKTLGAVRHHPDAGSWKLVARVPTDAGGPPRTLWERV